MPGTENILKTTLVGDSKQLRQELSKAEKGLKQFGDKAKAIGKTMSLYVTAPVVAAGGFAIKMASDFQESLNKVDVAFKGSSSEVKKFAKTTLDSFGIAEGTALDMAALFGDMSTSMGLNTQEASKMSTALVGLAGDLSSFKNMNIEEVTTALNGVFTGETESLKRLGIVMTEVNLKQFALEKGIKTQIKDMTQAQKVQLRYQYVMEKTANAHGDFARTSDGSANQMREFQELLKELGVLFGDVLLPEFTKIIKKVNEWLKELKNASPETKKFTVIIAGIGAAVGPALIALGSLASALVKVKVAFRALGTASSGPIGVILLAIGGLLFAFDQLTDKIAGNISLWEKLKITFNSGAILNPTGMPGAIANMQNASIAAGNLADNLKRISENRPKPEMQGVFGDGTLGGEGLYGMALLGSGPKKTKETKKSTELFSEADLAEQEELAAQFTELFSGYGTDIKFVAAASEIELENFQNNFGGFVRGMDDEANGLTEVGDTLDAFGERLKSFSENSAQIMSDGLQNMLGGIGSLLGAAAAGAKVGIGDLANVVLGGLGDMAVQLGKLAIKTGIAMKAIKLSFKNPATAIAAGVALIAIGSFVKGAAANIASGGDRGRNSIPAFASGGIVSGPTIGLMGEYPGARTNPEVIAPLDKLQSMLGNRGGNVNVTGEFRIKGQDLLVAIDRADKQKNRIG